jgi:hypothetical protein
MFLAEIQLSPNKLKLSLQVIHENGEFIHVLHVIPQGYAVELLTVLR